MPSLDAAGLSAGYGADGRPGLSGARLPTGRCRDSQLSDEPNGLSMIERERAGVAQTGRPHWLGNALAACVALLSGCAADPISEPYVLRRPADMSETSEIPTVLEALRSLDDMRNTDEAVNAARRLSAVAEAGIEEWMATDLVQIMASKEEHDDTRARAIEMLAKSNDPIVLTVLSQAMRLSKKHRVCEAAAEALARMKGQQPWPATRRPRRCAGNLRGRLARFGRHTDCWHSRGRGMLGPHILRRDS